MAHKGGRPSKLTPELHRQIVDVVRAGNYMETAAQYAGIDKVTLYRWLKRSRTETAGPHVEFRHAIEKAMAEAEARDVAIIGKAGQTQWQASAWRLERKFYERWGRKDRMEHTGKDGEPIAIKRIVHVHEPGDKS